MASAWSALGRPSVYPCCSTTHEPLPSSPMPRFAVNPRHAQARSRPTERANACVHSLMGRRQIGDSSWVPAGVAREIQRSTGAATVEALYAMAAPGTTFSQEELRACNLAALPCQVQVAPSPQGSCGQSVNRHAPASPHWAQGETGANESVAESRLSRATMICPPWTCLMRPFAYCERKGE